MLRRAASNEVEEWTFSSGVWSELATWYVETGAAWWLDDAPIVVVPINDASTTLVEWLGAERVGVAVLGRLLEQMKPFGISRVLFRSRPGCVESDGAATLRLAWFRAAVPWLGPVSETELVAEECRTEEEWHFVQSQLWAALRIGHQMIDEPFELTEPDACELWHPSSHRALIVRSPDCPKQQVVGYACWTDDWDPWTGELVWRLEDQGSVAGKSGAGRVAIATLLQMATDDERQPDVIGNVVGADPAICRSLRSAGWTHWRDEWSLS